MSDDPTSPGFEQLPLRERMPEYLAVFGVGIAASFLVGVLLWFFDNGLAAGFGYAMIVLGAVMFLAGGVAGGGYANLGVGAVGTVLSPRRPQDDGRSAGNGAAGDDAAPGRWGDPRERLRRGLRPEANPRAFWQVVGGFAYFALGTAIVVVFAN